MLSISWLTEQLDQVTVDNRDRDTDERRVFHPVTHAATQLSPFQNVTVETLLMRDGSRRWITSKSHDHCQHDGSPATLEVYSPLCTHSGNFYVMAGCISIPAVTDVFCQASNEMYAAAGADNKSTGPPLFVCGKGCQLKKAFVNLDKRLLELALGNR